MKYIISFLIGSFLGIAVLAYSRPNPQPTQKQEIVYDVDVNGARHCVICRAGVYSPREGGIRRCSFCDKPEP